MPSQTYLPCVYVDTGSFLVEKQSPKMLAACLGTCVGVALYDRSTRIGGIVHILLPEPLGFTAAPKPACYMTTGLPQLIDEMYKSGAQKETIQAAIAGGALIGPLSDQDFNLDIGGRSVEQATRILDREDIPVVDSETGGFFGYRLFLDLSSFTTTIEPVIEDGPHTGGGSAPQEIKDIESMIQRVKPIPQAALKLIRMIHSHDYDIGDIAQVVYGDQVISARVISLCNAAVFGLPSPVNSIQRALVMLGEKQLLQVVMLASVETYFTSATQGYSLCKGGLFQHGIRTAVICSVLAQTIGKVETDIAFTAGLLHDIGKTALDQHVAAAYPFFYREMTQEHRQLISVEKELLGVTHAEVGMRLAQLWSLPEPLIECIALHHEPRAAARFPELTALVSIADGILCLFQTGEELEHIHADVMLDALDILGLRLSDMPRLIDAIPLSVFKYTMLF